MTSLQGTSPGRNVLPLMQLLRSRRRFLLGASRTAGLAALASLGTWAAAQAPARPARRMPVLFIGHGSPMNALQDNPFTRHLVQLGQSLPRPVTILAVSAHWLTPGRTLVGVQAQPRTIHDFQGFPDALQRMEYPARGAPASAQETIGAVRSVPVAGSEDWGLDHGTWTVLRHLYPKADVPVFQLSIDYPRPGHHHYAIGQELAALRERGVLIVGSGNVVHNLRATVPGASDGLMAQRPWAQAFDSAVQRALEARDDAALIDYPRLDASASMAVPTPDHYWPFLYALGAAGRDARTTTTYAGFQGGTISMRCLLWGS